MQRSFKTNLFSNATLFKSRKCQSTHYIFILEFFENLEFYFFENKILLKF